MSIQPVVWSVICDRCGTEFCGAIYWQPIAELRKDLMNVGWAQIRRGTAPVKIEDLCRPCAKRVGE